VAVMNRSRRSRSLVERGSPQDETPVMRQPTRA
jgi:hypothetical protein